MVLYRIYESQSTQEMMDLLKGDLVAKLARPGLKASERRLYERAVWVEGGILQDIGLQCLLLVA